MTDRLIAMTWSQSMKDGEGAKNRELASGYVRSSFDPTDRLAVVLANKRSGSVIQRIATAEKIAAPTFQAWLRHQMLNPSKSTFR